MLVELEWNVQKSGNAKSSAENLILTNVKKTTDNALKAR